MFMKMVVNLPDKFPCKQGQSPRHEKANKKCQAAGKRRRKVRNT